MYDDDYLHTSVPANNRKQSYMLRQFNETLLESPDRYVIDSGAAIHIFKSLQDIDEFVILKLEELNVTQKKLAVSTKITV